MAFPEASISRLEKGHRPCSFLNHTECEMKESAKQATSAQKLDARSFWLGRLIYYSFGMVLTAPILPFCFIYGICHGFLQAR